MIAVFIIFEKYQFCGNKENVGILHRGPKAVYTSGEAGKQTLRPLRLCGGNKNKSVNRGMKDAKKFKKSLKNISDHVKVGIFQTDFEGNLLIANQAMSKIAGYADEGELMQSVDSLKELIWEYGPDDLIREREHDIWRNLTRNTGLLRRYCMNSQRPLKMKALWHQPNNVRRQHE